MKDIRSIPICFLFCVVDDIYGQSLMISSLYQARTHSSGNPGEFNVVASLSFSYIDLLHSIFFTFRYELRGTGETK